MSSEENEVRCWFDSISIREWYEIADRAGLAGGISPLDAAFLQKMARVKETRNPSVNELRKARKLLNLLQDIEIREASATSEDEGKHEEARQESEIRHVTIRMAWHDNGWNGRVCRNPEDNHYCVGQHSLLSDRIRRLRNTDIESQNREEVLDASSPQEAGGSDYQVPCYWSINAFGTDQQVYKHTNAAAIRELEPITEAMAPRTVFSWPFKLSFVRDQDLLKIDGKYPKNLEKRIATFRSRFTPQQSLVFLYCNFDNPVSAEERKYLLLGCSVLKGMGEPTYFHASETVWNELKARPNNQNFPRINWALRFELESDERTVLLPYHEYLRDAEQTNNYTLIDEMKVVIQEPELIESFKYVAMDIDDDQAIYLLTKLRRSLFIVAQHGRSDPDKNEKSIVIIDDLLKHCWRKRGYFPGLANLSETCFGNNYSIREGLNKIISDLQATRLNNLLSEFDNFVEGKLKSGIETEYPDLRFELREALRGHGILGSDFLRLAMLNLTVKQFSKILDDNPEDDPNLCGNRCRNPYLVFEDYAPSDELDDRDTGEKIDGNIDLYRIDIAMFPDTKCLQRTSELHPMSVHDPERIRAAVIDVLNHACKSGHCYEWNSNIEKQLDEYPLFYKSEYQTRKRVLTDLGSELREHLTKKMQIQGEGDRLAFYKKEVFGAEHRVRTAVNYLLRQPDHAFRFQTEIETSVLRLKDKLGTRFDEDRFRAERGQLYSRIFRKRLFVLSGSPGSGKSYELLRIIQLLQQQGQSYLVLAPTGKAALRLSKNKENIADVKVQTIDKVLFSLKRTRTERISSVENLIVDEASMVDLVKLDELLRHVEYRNPNFKRLILVGDADQLPPIGLGRAFKDLYDYLSTREEFKDNLVFLTLNLRQEIDDGILDLAAIFSGRSRETERIIYALSRNELDSASLAVSFYQSKAELKEQVKLALSKRYAVSSPSEDIGLFLDQVFGFCPDKASEIERVSKLDLDRFQILTPYRSGLGGALSLNIYFQNRFKASPSLLPSPFKRGDKVIQIENVYNFKKGELLLSNGSTGIALSGERGRFFFPEAGASFGSRELGEESIELAYAITVHKAQGSGFDDVFVIIPNRQSILSRELLYTALTRSRKSLTLFINGSPDDPVEKNLLAIAAKRSDSLRRNTSLFDEALQPFGLSPDEAINVKSKSEYIIYLGLKQLKQELGGFEFEYERPLHLSGYAFPIRPDFTISLDNGRLYFLEHLGCLGDYYYEKSWSNRRKIYETCDLSDSLITTDELRGMSNNKVQETLLELIVDGPTTCSKVTPWSRHHYTLG